MLSITIRGVASLIVSFAPTFRVQRQEEVAKKGGDPGSGKEYRAPFIPYCISAINSCSNSNTELRKPDRSPEKSRQYHRGKMRTTEFFSPQDGAESLSVALLAIFH